ncbi:hypothetical protein DEO72_LG8g2364 [Vigna unguiculata]|uniref:Uncharacterized protein n=1 Tax=Vigna unguiculata TaxID=3917 RepID=A0A4D6MTA6_VIGUN|nr:hypothetical protein DEO72_LG8g2364 [Vigna unguiculata]
MHHPSNLYSKAFKSGKQATTSLAIHIIAQNLPSLAQARDPLAQARNPLAQASPSSPRRELEQWNNGFCGFSLRRVSSRLGEITPRSK